MHLILDCFNCDLNIDMEAILTALPDTEVRPPEEASEIHAHASAHTDPATGRAWLDVFSPYEFDAAATVAYFVQALQAQAVDYQVIARGAQIREQRGRIPTAPWLRSGLPVPDNA